MGLLMMKHTIKRLFLKSTHGLFAGLSCDKLNKNKKSFHELDSYRLCLGWRKHANGRGDGRGFVEIQGRFARDSVIDEKVLREAGLIKSSLPVKILSEGELNVPLRFKISAFSKKAIEKITSSGGQILK